MNNNKLMITLIVLLGILTGMVLLNGINNTVQSSLVPVNLRLNSIEAQGNNILLKLGRVPGNDVLTRLDNIEREINALKEGPLAFGGGQPQQPQGPPPEDFNKVYDLPVKHSPVLGNKEAPVTITKFTDFQCPFCSRFYGPLKEVVKAYPDKVNIVIKNFPLGFHPNARPAAKLAFAANEQGKYFEMSDLLLESTADVSEEKVKEYAQKLGINYDQLMKDLKEKDSIYEGYIADDMSLAQSSDVMGTPTFFINGKKTMARDLNSYKQEIDKILAGQ